jgi:integrase
MSVEQISKILNKDFREWEKKDVEFVMAKLGDRNYKPWTIECFKVTFKVFYRWLNGLDTTDPAPKLVRWLSKETPPNRIRKEDLLTSKDIQDLMSATNKPMHKALISVLYAGPRHGEVLGIKMKDIAQFNGLIKIYVRGKMGRKMGERPIYIINYTEEFNAWIRRHPERHNPEAKLFICKNGCLRYANMITIVERLVKRAGIKKKVNCYTFRHTAGTRFYGKYEGSYARRLMGHAPGSKMEGVYCHLSEQDIEERLLGRQLPEDDEADIPIVEKETSELIDLGKAIKKLAEMHPEIINMDKLQEFVAKANVHP